MTYTREQREYKSKDVSQNICFGQKTQAYYTDEMKYGKLNFHYDKKDILKEKQNQQNDYIRPKR